MRLHDQHKRTIINNTIQANFGSRINANAARLTALGDRVLARAFTASEETAIAAIPAGWLPTIDAVKARYDGMTFALSLMEPKPVPFSIYQSPTITIPSPNGTNLASDIEAALAQDAALGMKIDDARRKLKKFLEEIRTDTELGEKWPEGAAYLDSAQSVPANTVDVSAVIEALRP